MEQTNRPKACFGRLDYVTPFPIPDALDVPLKNCFQQIFEISPDASAKLAIWLAEALLPDCKPPVLIITGKARDRAVEMLRDLIDPVSVPIIYTPWCPIELNSMALENQVLAFSLSWPPTEKLTRKLNQIHQGERLQLRHSNPRQPKLHANVARPIVLASTVPLEINKEQITIEINQAHETDFSKVFHALLNLVAQIVGLMEDEPKPEPVAPRTFAASATGEIQIQDSS